MTNKLINKLGIGALGLALAGSLTGCDNTHIKKVGDLTGDGIQDVLMYKSDIAGPRRGNYLFIGQKNGEFVKAKEVVDGILNLNFTGTMGDNFEYFETDNGEKYFFDGKFYRLSPKQKK